MKPERWQQVRDVLHGAMQLRPEERPAYLDRWCADDDDLREQISELLEAERGLTTDFLESLPQAEAALDRITMLAASKSEFATSNEPLVGHRVGSYRIVQEIGFGGMGEVYRAVRADDQFSKQVAIKLVRAGQDSKAVVHRFKNERQILAGLDHPNIARLLDGGETEAGLPYFVMELIEGLPIDRYCDNRKLAITDRLKLFRQVCSAVQYAHQHLIIHRDIKPGNILVTADGVPKLLDFGIAKILDPRGDEEQLQPTLTIHRALTPGYASPEQATGATITTASDLYSLGVVLYELLTGRSPYWSSGHAPQEIARAVCEIEPEKASAAVLQMPTEPGANGSPVRAPAEIAALRQSVSEKLSKTLRGDLDNIVSVALRKEPQRRYASVEQFSQDIQRHVDSLPVIARKDTFRYRTSKFVRRHKMAVVAGTAITATLLTAIVMLLHENRIAREEAENALRERTRAERHFQEIRELSDSLMFDIHDSIQNLPGSTPARRMLINSSLNYLDRLSSEAVGDKSLQRDMATVYEKIASVQGNPFDANLGDAKESIQSYQRAAAIWEALARANPPDPIDMLGLARTYRQLAGVVANTGAGDPVVLALKAIDIGEQLKDVASSDSRVWEELERDREMAGAIQVKTGGDPAGALENFQKALQIIEQHESDAVASESVPTRMALVEVNIGVSLAELGRSNRASEHFRTGLAKLRSEPKGSHLESAIALLQSRWGDILMMRGDAAQALSKYRLNLKLLAPMAAADPRNADLQAELGFAYARLGHALSQQRNENEALANLEKALVIFDSLVRQSGYSEGRGGLAFSHTWIAQILQSRGNITGAIQHYKQAQQQYLALRTAMPLDQNHQVSLAGNYRVIGSALLVMGKPKLAEHEYQNGIEIAEQLVTTRPGNVLAWWTLADLYFGIGEVSRSLALHATANLATQRVNWLAARQYYRKSVDAWRHIPDPGVSISTGLDCGNPVQVAQALAQADAAILHLQRGLWNDNLCGRHVRAKQQ